MNVNNRIGFNGQKKTACLARLSRPPVQTSRLAGPPALTPASPPTRWAGALGDHLVTTSGTSAAIKLMRSLKTQDVVG